MWKAVRASALALVTVGSLTLAGEGFVAPARAESLVLTEAHIARLKTALKLSPEQLVHWRALEAALRNIIRHPAAENGGGLVQRARARIGTYVLSAAAVQQVAWAARPLISSLDDSQKHEGMAAIEAMGVGALF